MADNIPYLGYELTGPRSVAEILEGSGITCVSRDAPAIEELFESRPGVLMPGRDAVRVGSFAKEGRELFFAEFALRIHDGLVSHVSFLFDYMPVLADLQVCADDMEAIVLRTLKKHQQEKGGTA